MTLTATAIEKTWAGRGWIAAPDRKRNDGPSPDELAVALRDIRALLAAPPQQWALAPLAVLMAAAGLADAEADVVSEGSDRLRELGLEHLATVGRDGDVESEGKQYIAAAAPTEMHAVLRARITAERPPVPEWIGPPRQSGDIIVAHGEPSDEDLDEMGLTRLAERMQGMEQGRRMAEARAIWVREHQYSATDQAIESGASATYAKVYGATRDAFDRAPPPTEWNVSQVWRPIMDKIATDNPQLAHTMMTGENPVQVVDRLAA